MIKDLGAQGRRGNPGSHIPFNRVQIKKHLWSPFYKTRARKPSMSLKALRWSDYEEHETFNTPFRCRTAITDKMTKIYLERQHARTS